MDFGRHLGRIWEGLGGFSGGGHSKFHCLGTSQQKRRTWKGALGKQNLLALCCGVRILQDTTSRLDVVEGLQEVAYQVHLGTTRVPQVFQPCHDLFKKCLASCRCRRRGASSNCQLPPCQNSTWTSGGSHPCPLLVFFSLQLTKTKA